MLYEVITGVEAEFEEGAPAVGRPQVDARSVFEQLPQFGRQAVLPSPDPVQQHAVRVCHDIRVEADIDLGCSQYDSVYQAGES